ncbi:MAG: hypothetical protein L6R37_003146 [Teloschistes peruensis]|nr:MAG: hypothetical protein L6R37_003146 [Teloschistes peruensis]
MKDTPFNEEVQLNIELTILHHSHCLPSRIDDLIEHTDGKSKHLPGQPLISLSPDDLQEIEKYVSDELLTPDLNTMAPYLWLVATPDSLHQASTTFSSLLALLALLSCTNTTYIHRYPKPNGPIYERLRLAYLGLTRS